MRARRRSSLVWKSRSETTTRRRAWPSIAAFEVSGAGFELDLLDGEAELVQTADPGFDGECVPDGDGLDMEQLRPEVLVSTPHSRGCGELVVHRFRMFL